MASANKVCFNCHRVGWVNQCFGCGNYICVTCDRNETLADPRRQHQPSEHLISKAELSCVDCGRSFLVRVHTGQRRCPGCQGDHRRKADRKRKKAAA